MLRIKCSAIQKLAQLQGLFMAVNVKLLCDTSQCKTGNSLKDNYAVGRRLLQLTPVIYDKLMYDVGQSRKQVC